MGWASVQRALAYPVRRANPNAIGCAAAIKRQQARTGLSGSPSYRGRPQVLVLAHTVAVAAVVD